MKVTLIGKLFFVIMVLGLAGTAAYLLTRPKPIVDTTVTPAAAGNAGNSAPAAAQATIPTKDDEVVDAQEHPKRLDAPLTYNPTNNTVIVELSEYAGYAGFIAANKGLAPNEDSIFFKKYGFKVKINISEEESWNALNSGKMAASATTVDVLAAYGKQMNVVAPVQIDFSRGADAVVTTSDIKKINDLKGKTVACCQFTESDFFIRYLTQEAGLNVNMIPNLQTPPDPNSVNVVYTSDGFPAGDLFLRDVQNNYNRLSGFVAWAPKTDEIADALKSKAHMLATSRNLLVIADILVVNRGFAAQYPKMVEGLVGGLLEGNLAVQSNASLYCPIVDKAFKWAPGKTQHDLGNIHLSNVPENKAFFSGDLDAAGSFGGIFNNAVLAYGTIIKDEDRVDSSAFLDSDPLKLAASDPVFANQRIDIAPIKLAGAYLEKNPLLSKNIRFLFAPNSADLDMTNQENLKQLQEIKQLLTVSPGSSLLLRGHVDDGQKEEFAKGGDQRLRDGALRAMKLSLDRANTVRSEIVKIGVTKDRIDTIGRGWEESLGSDRDANRRVEVQWFTLE